MSRTDARNGIRVAAAGHVPQALQAQQQRVRYSDTYFAAGRWNHPDILNLAEDGMGQSSVTSHSDLLEATAERFRRLFGESAVRVEAAPPLAAASANERHESWRSRLESRSPFELLRSNPTEAIERRLRRLGFSDDVIRGAVERGPALEGRFDSGRIGLERIIGRNELLAIRYLDAGQRACQAVGRVVIRSSSGSTLGYGTGSMISTSLLMTNNHVLDTSARAGNSVVEFNFQLGLDGTQLTKVTFRLRPDLFFTTSSEDELDLTIVAVSTEPTLGSGASPANFGFNPLSADRDEILAGESVTIIQHPGGELKQIALRENRVLRFPNIGERFLYYETDTSPGSSGAPVFNDQWEVVALHHSGFPERDNQGRILTPDGQIWNQEMGDDRIHWIANEGIRVLAIREFLATLSNLSAPQGALRDGVLNPPSLPLSPQPDEGQIISQSTARQAAATVPQSQPVRGATAVWNIPLTISISMGVPGPGWGTVVAPGMPPLATHAPPPPVVTSPPQADEPDDADFEAAKKAFAVASTRAYYDAAADQAARTDYYAGIAGTLNRLQLFDALSDFVSQTHQNTLGYKPMVYLYPWVDLQPDTLKIKSVYSDQVFDPVELIARDFEVARLRRERLLRFRTTESAEDPVLEGAFLESLEAQLPYNCEHVVPQSWFQKKQPMKGDLHHLFACESGCNSFRSNAPYFDFADFREAIRSDCGKRDVNKFEPEHGKGPIARATLYFLLRYPGKVNATADEYTADRLQILLTWHQDHPVTDYERHRNQAIFEVQGNRNPLIDHPEWAKQSDWSRGLG